MRPGLIEAIARGEHRIWLFVGLLWFLSAGLVLLPVSRRRHSFGRVFAVSSLASALSLVGMAVATAVSIPRIHYTSYPSPELVQSTGETWRRLRGPAVGIVEEGAPDIAVASVDRDGAWRLFGFFSGKPIARFGAAPPVPPETGAPRLCSTDEHSVEACRAWPSSWPDPATAPPFAEFSWSKESTGTPLAYDVESRLFLREISLGDGRIASRGWTSRAGPSQPLEVMGKVTSDTIREGSAALFVLRRVNGTKLEAMRLIATAAQDAPDRFQLQRASTSLRTGPFVRDFVALPLLAVGVTALPLSLLAYALAPWFFAAHLRRRKAVRAELSAPASVVPIAGREEEGLGVTSDDLLLGRASVLRGGVVRLPPAAFRYGEPVTSQGWFELPKVAAPGAGAPAADLVEIVPADAVAFRRTARGWTARYALAGALLVAGLSAAAPAIVAAVSLAVGT